MQKQTLIMQGLVLYLIILVSCSRVLEPVTDEPTDMTPVIVTAVEQTATPPASTAVAPMATPHTAPNLLYNPGFDEACRHVSDSQCIPLGWEFTDNCLDYDAHVELETHPSHVLSGPQSALLWQDWRACRMTLYQTVNLAPGAVIAFYAHGFSKGHTLETCPGCPDKDFPTPPDLAGFMRICVDPDGGRDVNAGGVVCSPISSPRDQFQEFMLIAPSHANQITVFLDGWFQWGVTRNSLIWDDAELYLLDNMQNAAATSTPSIIETQQPGGNLALGAVGVVVFQRDTLLRTCIHAFTPQTGWPDILYPVEDCDPVLDDNGQAQVLGLDDQAMVWGFAYDRFHNLWAWLDGIGWLTAAACHNGGSRLVFYPAIELSQYDDLAAQGALPPSRFGCGIDPQEANHD